MRQVLLGIGLVAMLAIAPAASARQSDTMIGDGKRERSLANEMSRLRQVSPGSARDGLCPLVRGASAEVNNYVASRMRQVSQQIGARYANRSCEPNVVVLFSSDPDELIGQATLAKRFNYRGVSENAVEQFKASTQPVRWVHGGPARDAGDARPHNTLVVVDANQAAKVKISALADYLVMVSLADVGIRAAPNNSIMNLFDEAKRGDAQALTEADKAYLTSVHRLRDARF